MKMSIGDGKCDIMVSYCEHGEMESILSHASLLLAIAVSQEIHTFVRNSLC